MRLMRHSYYLMQSMLILAYGCSGLSISKNDSNKWQANIYSNPPGAEIYVDGIYTGTAPFKYEYPSVGISRKELVARLPPDNEQHITSGYYIFELFFDFIANKATIKEYPSAFSLSAKTREVSFDENYHITPEMLQNAVSGLAEMRATMPSGEPVISASETKPSDISKRKSQKQSHSDVYKEKQKEFEERNPRVDSNYGALEYTVRMASPADFPDESYQLDLAASGIGGAGLGLGLVAPPMYASALVVGGVFLIPGGLYLHAHDKRIWDSISTALSEVELTRTMDKLMQDRLPTFFSKESAPAMKVEINVLEFGINPSACFVFSADFALIRGNERLVRDRLNITEEMRSADAPPPQCASLEHFAENEAKLVKEILNEYAEVAVVMALERIRTGTDNEE